MAQAAYRLAKMEREKANWKQNHIIHQMQPILHSFTMATPDMLMDKYVTLDLGTISYI